MLATKAAEWKLAPEAVRFVMLLKACEHVMDQSIQVECSSGLYPTTHALQRVVDMQRAKITKLLTRVFGGKVGRADGFKLIYTNHAYKRPLNKATDAMNEANLAKAHKAFAGRGASKRAAPPGSHSTSRSLLHCSSSSRRNPISASSRRSTDNNQNPTTPQRRRAVEQGPREAQQVKLKKIHAKLTGHKRTTRVRRTARMAPRREHTSTTVPCPQATSGLNQIKRTSRARPKANAAVRCMQPRSLPPQPKP